MNEAPSAPGGGVAPVQATNAKLPLSAMLYKRVLPTTLDSQASRIGFQFMSTVWTTINKFWGSNEQSARQATGETKSDSAMNVASEGRPTAPATEGSKNDLAMNEDPAPSSAQPAEEEWAEFYTSFRDAVAVGG